MTYLLDTNVLSETRKRKPVAGVAGWIAATPPDRLHLSVLTLGEIEQGIATVRGRGTGTRLPPSSAGSGMCRPGSKTGFSRSPCQSPLPGAVSSTRSPSR